MKAVVLSCDKYRPFTDHMIRSYRQSWPSHPFRFRVPFQSDPTDLQVLHGDAIEMIESPPDIKRTVLALIEDIDDEEWIFWCIDDKYPVELNESAANDCLEWVAKVSDPSVSGLMFCRCRKLLEPENLDWAHRARSPGGEEYIRRKNYYQFWIPQFLRAGILRALFMEFPDRPFEAKEMDLFTGQEPGMAVKEFSPDQQLYVSRRNHARFGESTVSGRVTPNCKESMQKLGISTAGFQTTETSILIGEIKAE